jgi:hypothetical protein
VADQAYDHLKKFGPSEELFKALCCGTEEDKIKTLHAASILDENGELAEIYRKGLKI